MAANGLYDAFTSRVNCVECENGKLVFKRDHVFITISENKAERVVFMNAGFYLDSEERHIEKLMFCNADRSDITDMLCSLVAHLVDSMTIDDEYYNFDEFVAAKCILDWLLYV